MRVRQVRKSELNVRFSNVLFSNYYQCPSDCGHGTCNNRGSCTCECGWTGDDCNQLTWCHEKFTLAWILLIVCVVLVLTGIILIYLWCVLYNGRKWSSPCQAEKQYPKDKTSLVVTNYENTKVKTGSYSKKGTDLYRAL